MSKARKISQAQAQKRTAATNDYEMQRLLNIRANNAKLEALNIKRVSASFTSLVDSTKEKKRKGKERTTLEEDEDYEPAYDLDLDLDDDVPHKEAESCENGEQEQRLRTTKQTLMKEGRKRSQFIRPLSLANFLKMNEKQRREVIGDEALKSISSAMEIVQQAICNRQPSSTEVDQDDFNCENDFTNGHLDEIMDDIERDSYNDTLNIDNDRQMDEHDEEGSDKDDTYHNEAELSGDKAIICVDSDLTNSGKLKKASRGTVYCRKLTSLDPGEKIYVEFNEDGIPVGDNGSIFAFFLGEQVRNRAVCPVQVNGWEDFTSVTLDHLWSCILEKCEFDNPELRREGVMKHARNLFRDSRYKLKRKYIMEPNLTTKESQLKNKPKDMLKADWKFLVELWRSPKFEEKSAKAKENRSFLKMPHYTGTKSHARVKEEFKKKTGRDCSRVDVLMETRKRKSKKPVDPASLECNMHAIDEVKKLKDEREEGLNQMTDEQILTEVLGKDTRGYLRCYGRGKTITRHFGVKPARIDLASEVQEVKKSAEDIMLEAKKAIENARKEVEEARKEREEARKDAEAAKKETQAIRDEVVTKMADNNKVWEQKVIELLKTYGIGPSH